MINVIIAPHTDDAIFSMGNWMDSMEELLIISVMAGIPSDAKGRLKHETIREEHKKACELYGVKHIESDFLDDVYPGIDRKAVKEWLETIIPLKCNIFVPLGIHHPDHILVRDIFVKHFPIDFFYEELPYRVDYPFETEYLRKKYLKGAKQWTAEDTEIKHQGVEAYASEIVGGTILPRLFVEERMWKV